MVQRTKLVDETQDMLLEMLEDMTTGKPAGGSALHPFLWLRHAVVQSPAPRPDHGQQTPSSHLSKGVFFLRLLVLRVGKFQIWP